MIFKYLYDSFEMLMLHTNKNATIVTNITESIKSSSDAYKNVIINKAMFRC
jgi:hypothetical protein